MIEIRIEGKTVDMAPDTSLALELVSPYFGFDAIEPSRVLPFTLPFTPTNRKVFRWFEKPESTVARSQTYYAEKYSDSHCLEKGIVEVLDVSEAGYNLVFIKNLSDLFGEYGNDSLNKLPLGSEPIPSVFGINQDPNTDKYCWPTVVNNQFYGTNATSVRVNDYNGTAYVSGGPMVPMFFVKWLLLKIATLCNFEIDGDFLNHSTWQRLIIYNTYSLDGQMAIVYNNHLPELRVMELFIEIRKMLCLTFDFDMGNRRLTIGFMDDVLSAPTATNWNAKNKWATNKRPLRETRLELSCIPDSGDGLTKTPSVAVDKYLAPFDALNPREQIFKIEIKFSSLKIDQATGLPVAEQVGISPQYGQMTNKFSPRLLFYDTANLASAQYLTNTLYITGANGLHQKRWAVYEAWRKQTFETKQKVWLTSADLVKFKFNKKVFINGQNYLVAAINTGLPIKNLSDITLFKV